MTAHQTTLLTTILATLKTLDLADWAPTFWLVKRKAHARTAKYSVLRVEMDERLKERFRGYFRQQLQTRDFHLEPYEFFNVDTDDVLLTLDKDATDFPKVEAVIEQGFDNPIAREYGELLNSWAYVVQFEHGEKRLYAWRQISAMTDPKKVKSKKATFFQNQKLIDVDDEQVFLIDPRFDFFVFEDTTFIASKRAFENAMNFREGMKKNGSELLHELNTMDFLSDVAPIQTYVSDNLHHLRKLASIKQSGYYKQPHYVSKLMKVSQEESWGLKIADGKIVVELQTMELLLKLLNNDRLRSPINDELFDSAAKTKVAKKVPGS
jgi:Domain of unknown function (DUF4868)